MSRSGAEVTYAQGDLRWSRRYKIIDMVADYGCDRSGTVDCSAIVDQVIQFCNANGGGYTLYFPSGSYNLKNGMQQRFTTGNNNVKGDGMAATFLTFQSGMGFAFGDPTGAVATTFGGSVSDLYVTYGNTPDAGAQFLDFQNAQSQKVRNLMFYGVRKIAALGGGGSTASATGSGITMSHLYGSTDPAAGAIGIDVVKGSGFTLSDVSMYSRGVGYPTDATSLHPAQDTAFLRIGQGSYDTIQCDSVVANRYNRSLVIDAQANTACVNFWFTNCVFDVNKTNGLYMHTNTGSNLRTVNFTDCWFVAKDGNSVHLDGTAGTALNIKFVECVAREAGQNNWRFTSTVASSVELNGCYSWAANRLAGTNTGNQLDDTVILGNGVTLRGGSFGQDGTSNFGFPYVGRYGINAATDVDMRIVGVEANGSTSAFVNFSGTVANRRRLVRDNRTADGSLPAYATITALTPASNTVQTHTGYTANTIYIYGGAVTSVQLNGTEIGTATPVQLNLMPGDTWKVIYTTAPTVKQVVMP